MFHFFTWLNKPLRGFKPWLKHLEKDKSYIEERYSEHLYYHSCDCFCFSYKNQFAFLFYKFIGEKIVIVEIQKMNGDDRGFELLELLKRKENAECYCHEKKWYDSKNLEDFVDFVEEKKITLIDEITKRLKDGKVISFNKVTVRSLEKIIRYKTREKIYIFLNSVKKFFINGLTFLITFWISYIFKQEDK